MAIEIERKFLLKSDAWKAHVSKRVHITQAYLSSHKERTVRVRIIGNEAWLTIKGKSVLATRPEFEYKIPVEEAQQLLNLCEQPYIEKYRNIVELNGNIWEIDEFLRENEGLVFAEVELEKENQDITIPDWIGEEITHDARYYNSNLIAHPFIKW